MLLPTTACCSLKRKKNCGYAAVLFFSINSPAPIFANENTTSACRILYHRKYFCTQKKHLHKADALLTGNFLSSQGVSTQVLSASECLTTVFGMGTGGTIQASSPDMLRYSLKTIQKKKC